MSSPPAAASDRLFLVAMSGQPEFRPLYDALLRMGFYNFNPDVIRELQSPDTGEVLSSDGRNLASVLKRLAEQPGGRMERLVEMVGKVVPGITGASHKPVGKKETLEFRQLVAGSKDAWRFDAENMSDGTLRALGVLVALFQPPASDGRAVRIVGIEEPETPLHPGAATVLRAALFEASRNTQVIVTSHSPDLLDDKKISADFIVSVTSRAGETILGSVDEASRTSIRDHLFTAGELLRLNQLGTDEAAYEQIQPNLFAHP
jgi:predicted ATPase